MKQIKTKIHALYLSWINEFITVGKFAEHHNLTHDKAIQVIHLGHIIHEQNVQAFKLTGIEPYKI